MQRAACLPFLAATLVLVITSGCAVGQQRGPQVADLFGIYTVRLSGKDFKPIVTNATKEMTHPRYSPDGEWICFTRYNKVGSNGFAMEENGYTDTEIVIVGKDGSDMKTVVPPKAGVINANASWVDGGNGLIWISSDNPKRLPQIMKIDLRTKKVTRMPTPDGVACTDPHLVNDVFVFPAVNQTNNPLYIMAPDGSQSRKLTTPDVGRVLFGGKHSPGDYDPRISPDGSQVAFMRLYGSEGWRVYVKDIKTGKEQDLSGEGSIDTLPAWSSDGKLLVFWHIDKRNLKEMGLYTMKPDGSDRRMIAVPRGYLHGHPAFHPLDGSSGDPRIIYRATKAPQLP